MKCRSMRRKAGSDRWDKELFNSIKGTPWEPMPGRLSTEVPINVRVPDEDQVIMPPPMLIAHPRLLLCIMFARTSHVVGACHSRHRHHRYHVLSCLLFWSTTRYSSPSHTSASSHGRAHTSERCHLYI